MKLLEPSIWMPFPPNLLMTRPRTVLPPAVMRNPLAPAPALLPFSSMMGVLVNPGWVVPSRLVGRVSAGSGLCGAMVYGAAPEEMLKRMFATPPDVAFAFRMACRNDPAPLSAVLVTIRTGGSTVYVSVAELL